MVLQLISHSLAWLTDKAHTKAQDALIAVLSAGPVPQHVAFILDGNRRYARSKNMQIKEGHTDGFYTLRKVCQFRHFVRRVEDACLCLRRCLKYASR